MKESIVKAYQLTESMMQDLQEAESFGILNMAGGGIAADLVKYDKLDSVRKKMKELRNDLEEIRTTKDNPNNKVQIEPIDESLRIADLFLDDVGSALLVLDKIGEAKEQIRRLQGEIKKLEGIEQEAL